MTDVTLVVQSPAWPAESGIGRRVQALHAELSAAHNVSVVACLPESSDTGSPPESGFVRLDRPPGGFGAVPRLALAFARGLPLTPSFYVSRRLRAQLAQTLHTSSPDVVVAQGLGSALLIQGLHPLAKTIVDLADAEHERALAIGRSGGWRKAPYRADGARIAHWIARRLPTLGAATVVSPHDLDSYRDLAPGANVVLCPNGSALPALGRVDPGGNRLMFLGDLKYAPNSDGLQWFIDNVLPGLPQATLRVVGRGSVRGAQRVELLGFVPDLQREWDLATALVVPLFVGGGTRIKVLDGLAAGVPIISTKLGVAGLDLEPDVHYVRAETAEQMRGAVNRVLSDRALRERLSIAGRDIVARRYSWDRCLAPLNAEVRRLGG